MNRRDLSLLILRIGLSAIFLYFGVLAIQDPSGQGAIWINQNFTTIIERVASVNLFMTTLGIVQVIVSVFTMLGVYVRYTSSVAIILLLGIIVNLGFNDIALRDFAILTGHLFLVLNGGGRYVLVGKF